jgi:hypothetical protein
MAIFETKLDDKSHIYVTKQSPGQKGQPVVSSLTEDVTPARETIVTPEFDHTTGRLVAFTGRLHIVSDEGKRILQEKLPITVEQSGICNIDMVF